MISPEPWARIAGSTARVQWKAPVRLVAIISFQVSRESTWRLRSGMLVPVA